jgi:spore germination protein GerM
VRRLLLVCVAGALTLTACGVGVQDEPTPVDTRAAAADRPPTPDGTASVLYFVRNDRLAPVLRRTSSDERSRLAALLDGVAPEEAARGLRDALPATLELRDVRRTGTLLTVDVHGDLGEATAAEQTLAVAQIVFTATEPAVGVTPATDVQLLVDGTAVEVPRADGSLTGDDLDRADFPAITEASARLSPSATPPTGSASPLP